MAPRQFPEGAEFRGGGVEAKGHLLVGRENRWLVLGLLFAVRTSMSFQFQTIASSGALLMDAIHIDYARLGTLIGLYMLPGVAIAMPGGLLGNRFGGKQVVVAGLALMALGGAIDGVSTNFAMMVVGRVVSGTGAVLLNVLVTKLVADWFAGAEITTAMSVLVSSWPLGLALGLLLFPTLLQAAGWRAVMHAGAAVAGVSLIALVLLYRDPPGQAGPTAEQSHAGPDLNLDRREWRLALIAGVVWGAYNIGYIVLISFMPDALQRDGYDAAQASHLVSLLGWALIPLIPLGGYLAQRSGRPNLVMLVGFFAVAAASVAVAFVDHPLSAFAVIVLVGGLPAGLIMALPAEVLRPQARAAGMGLYFTCYYLLIAVLPGLAGVARDISGAVSAPIIFAGAMMLCAAAALGVFRAAQR
jgi:predicted MFS family arabinose efflux permease